MARQIIIWGKPKNKKTKGAAVNRNSIGTIWINDIPRTYNSNLVYRNPVTVDRIVDDDSKNKRKRKIIIIRRR